MSVSRPIGRCFPPFCAVLLAILPLSAACLHAGFAEWSAKLLLRWDSFHYLTIAEEGYTLWVDQNAAWRGTAGWFPGYPWLIRALSSLGVSPALAAVTISLTAHLLTLWLLWNEIIKPLLGEHGFEILIFCAVFPGCIYFYAGFPVSVFTLCVSFYALSLSRRKYLGAGIAAAAASVIYPIGIVLVPITILWHQLIRRRGELALQSRQLALPLLLPLLAFVSVLLIQRQETGHFDAFFLVQREMGSTVYNPFNTLYRKAISPLSPGIVRLLLNEESIALKSVDGKFVCAEWGGDREITANRDVRSHWEAFLLRHHGERDISLQTMGGYFFHAEQAPSNELNAKSKRMMEQEMFAITPLGNQRVALVAKDGRYVTVNAKTRRLELRSGPIDSYASFTKLPGRHPWRRLDQQITALHTILMLGFVFAVTVALLRSWRKADPLFLFLGLYLAVVFSIPFFAGPHINMQRASATLMPAAVLLGLLSTKLRWLLIVLAGLLSFPTGWLFFKEILT